MPKRKSIQEIVSRGEWKSVQFKKAGIDEEDFDFGHLLHVEELTDYDLTKVDGLVNKSKKKVEDKGESQLSKKKFKAEKRKEERRQAKLAKEAARALPASQELLHAPDKDQQILDSQTVLSRPSSEKRTRKSRKTAKEASPPPRTVEFADDDEADWEDEESAEDADKHDDDDWGESVDVSKWKQLDVCPAVLKALSGMNFTSPTPIQEACLPLAIRSRKDIIGAAETGSGKTLAFAIPIVQNILEDKCNEAPDKAKYLRALIITPTRELAVQIKKHITTVAKFTDVTTCLVVGGMFKEKQDRLLLRQPDIVIATPGRLFEHIQNQTPYLRDVSSVRYLVIDEADRMTERGHFKELADIMEIFSQDGRAAAKRQTFVFSATLSMDVDFSKPDRNKSTKEPEKKKKKKDEMEEGADRLANLCSLLGLKSTAKLIDLSKPEGTAGSLVERRLPCTLKDKDYLFYYLLMTEATGRVIVFCNSLDCVRRLHGVFSYLLTETGRTPLVLHAGMHQKQRLKNLERFQANPLAVLLASDVASRGLDIPDVQFVIHYQVPRNPDLYVHRSGRTARAFKVGSSVLLVDPSDAPASQKILRCLHRQRDFPLVEVDSKMLRFAKERVDLARRIDVVEHALRKESSKDEWYLKAAEEADLVMEKEERSKLDIQKANGRSRQSKEAKALKRLMKSVLMQPLKSRMPGFSHQYPTLNFAKAKMGFS